MDQFSCPGYPNVEPDMFGGTLIEGHAPPPRHFAADTPQRERLRVERAQTQHGPAMVGWLNDQPMIVWNARFGNERIHCLRSAFLPKDDPRWRRRSSDGRGWRVGRIAISPEDVAFFDTPPAAYEPSPEASELERDIAANGAFMERLQDDSLATGLNLILRNADLRRHASAERFGMSFGDIAEMIANLRGVGETFADFKFGGLDPAPPKADFEEITRLLWDAGWRFVTPTERFQEHREAWRLLRSYEQRPPSPAPDWAVARPPRGLRDSLPGPRGQFRTDAEMARIDWQALNTRFRLVRMALTGRVSKAEYDALQTVPQSELRPYERRPERGVDREWKRLLEAEFKAIETTAIDARISGWSSMPEAGREEVYCPELGRRVDAAARTGRVTREEWLALMRMFDWDRA